MGRGLDEYLPLTTVEFVSYFESNLEYIQSVDSPGVGRALQVKGQLKIRRRMGLGTPGTPAIRGRPM